MGKTPNISMQNISPVDINIYQILKRDSKKVHITANFIMPKPKGKAPVTEIVRSPGVGELEKKYGKCQSKKKDIEGSYRYYHPR